MIVRNQKLKIEAFESFMSQTRAFDSKLKLSKIWDRTTFGTTLSTTLSTSATIWAYPSVSDPNSDSVSSWILIPILTQTLGIWFSFLSLYKQDFCTQIVTKRELESFLRLVCLREFYGKSRRFFSWIFGSICNPCNSVDWIRSLSLPSRGCR